MSGEPPCFEASPGPPAHARTVTVANERLGRWIDGNYTLPDQTQPARANAPAVPPDMDEEDDG